MTTFLEDWSVPPDMLDELMKDNPSLRGIMMGYVAEKKLEQLLSSYEDVTNILKESDHNRDTKWDYSIIYKGHSLSIEVKSLLSHSIYIKDPNGQWIPLMKKRTIGRKPSPGLKKDGTPKLGRKSYEWYINPEFTRLSSAYRKAAEYKGMIKCCSSDKRKVVLPNGNEVVTNLLEVGSFDVLSACVFSFKKEWEFGFALSEDLPKDKNCNYFLSSHVNISYPMKGIFNEDPIKIFDRIIQKREQT